MPGSADRLIDYAARGADSNKLSSRAKPDAILRVEVRRVFVENFGVYDVRKVWQQTRRESFNIARCKVSRLMREIGLKGVSVILGPRQRLSPS